MAVGEYIGLAGVECEDNYEAPRPARDRAPATYGFSWDWHRWLIGIEFSPMLTCFFIGPFLILRIR